MSFNWKTLNPFYNPKKDHQGERLWPSVQNWFSERWNDLTGQTAISQQNQANLEMSKYQAQMQEDFYNKYSSPSALMRQFQEAGLNPNLVYGSAASGQSNVPSFSAPNIERNLSGAQKVEKTLGLLSAISGVVTGVYQAAAAREAAQQSAVKTANDIVNYRGNYLDNVFRQDLLGSKVSIDSRGLRLFRSGRDLPTLLSKSPVYNTYLGAYRESEFNKFADPVFRNYYDYGGMYDLNGQFRTSNYLKEGLLPYYHIRNNTNQLKYNLMEDLGNKGVYGKLAIGLLKTFF